MIPFLKMCLYTDTFSKKIKIPIYFFRHKAELKNKEHQLRTSQCSFGGGEKLKINLILLNSYYSDL